MSTFLSFLRYLPTNITMSRKRSKSFYYVSTQICLTNSSVFAMSNCLIKILICCRLLSVYGDVCRRISRTEGVCLNYIDCWNLHFATCRLFFLVKMQTFSFHVFVSEYFADYEWFFRGGNLRGGRDEVILLSRNNLFFKKSLWYNSCHKSDMHILSVFLSSTKQETPCIFSHAVYLHACCN